MSTLSLGPPPGQPSVTVGSTTATTISLSWSVLNGSVADSYEVMWERERDGTRTSATITDGSTSYTIRGLEVDSSYTITVTATNAVESIATHPVTVVTEEEGEQYDIRISVLACHFYEQERCIIEGYLLQCHMQLLRLHPLWEESFQVF